MNCVLVYAGNALQPAAAGNCETASRFSELLNADPQREIVYVDGPAQGSDKNGVLRAMSEFQSADFALGAPPRSTASGGSPDESGESFESSELGQLAEIGHEAMMVQAQILRTTMMMETVNSAKQGVTTLFQQQG